MQKLDLAHGAASPLQTPSLACTVPPSRRATALAGLAGQLHLVLTELLAGESYRTGIPPHLHRDVGLGK
ncbi:hypothetical protein [Niveispirillum fermenti]|uniref:hypothetical protein n=1 Tax=Niveispirillum fermenti TaxID=1233113 RepID=UPI003A841C82